jgi:hypothetical protein
MLQYIIRESLFAVSVIPYVHIRHLWNYRISLPCPILTTYSFLIILNYMSMNISISLVLNTPENCTLYLQFCFMLESGDMPLCFNG